MSKASKSLIIVQDLTQTLDRFGCAPFDLIEEVIEKFGFQRDLEVSDIGRAIRVYTGVEYTACDDDFVPSNLSMRKATVFLRPDRVLDKYKSRHRNWLQAIGDSWLAKATKFGEQM